MLEYPTSHRFRAYATLGDGATDQMTWLAKHGCIPFADANDLAGYVQALQNACYVGCPPEGNMSSYQAGIASAMNKYNGIVPVPYVESPLRSLTNTGALLIGGALVALAAGTAYVIHEGAFDEHPRRRGARDNPAKLERCVRKVKRQKGAKNAWAICRAALKM
jgi:hypothetical protein